MDLKHVEEHVRRLQIAKKVTAEMKEMAEASRAAVEEALGDNEAGELDGELVVTWKHGKTSRLNQKALKAERPEVVAEYTEAKAERRFEVK
jgi:predicted phage-related endonuclease